MPIYPFNRSPFNRDDSSSPLHTGPALSRREALEIFKEMVRTELRNGPLAPRRRKRLIQYAAALQLKPLEASRIITSICLAEKMKSPVEESPPTRFRWSDEVASEPRVPVWLKIIAPLAAAFLLDRLIRTLF